MRTLLEAIKVCHNHSILHRDIKLDNIMFRNHTCKPEDLVLIDFGHSRFIDQEMVYSHTYGTVEFSSLELLDNHPYTFATDIWSLGVICYIMYVYLQYLRVLEIEHTSNLHNPFFCSFSNYSAPIKSVHHA